MYLVQKSFEKKGKSWKHVFFYKKTLFNLINDNQRTTQVGLLYTL